MEPHPAFWNDLEHDPSVVFALDAELHITYCNRAWDRFALENGGAGLEREGQIGRSLLEVIPNPLAPFFRRAYQNVLITGESWVHTYECSSATVKRSMVMRVTLAPEGGGLVVANSIIRSEPHGANPEQRTPDGCVYHDEAGRITMCGNCRQTRRAGPEGIWDWVPAHLEGQRPIRYFVCPACLTTLYSGTGKLSGH